jgi:adenylate kinase
MPHKIIIAGAPASGKGTQCEFIREEFGVVHLSTGDMLRAAVKAGTPVGLEAKGYMDSGKLVPDSTIINVIVERLKESDCVEKGWLLDGFPRTGAQAEALAAAGAVPNVVLFLNVADELLVERVVGRRTDPETGIIYHLKYKPPPADVPVERLQHRSDDTEEKVKVRLEQFHSNLKAILDSYQGKIFELKVTDNTLTPKLTYDKLRGEIIKGVDGSDGKTVESENKGGVTQCCVIA